MENIKHTADTYDKIADKYAEEYFDDISDLPYIDKFLSYCEKDSNILDVGCGVGNFSQYMFSKGCKVVGIDLSEEMLKIAKERVKNINFTLMDMRHLNFEDEKFDGILSAYSLIHIPSSEILSTLKEFARVLKTKGKILLIVQKGEKDRIVNEPLKKGEKIFINFFDLGTLISELKEAGFNVLFKEVKENHDLGSMSNQLIAIIAEKA